MAGMTSFARLPRAALTAASVLTAVAMLSVVPTANAATTITATSLEAGQALPIGDQDLVETRTSRVLANGVTLTQIVRGTDPAPADQINTTTRGPWVVNVLTIDPATSKGRLQTTYGPDLARVEKTSDLVRSAGAVAGVNASFFTFTASVQYPGDPVGLGISDGKLLSEPLTDSTEANLLIDANSNKVLMAICGGLAASSTAIPACGSRSSSSTTRPWSRPPAHPCPPRPRALCRVTSYCSRPSSQLPRRPATVSRSCWTGADASYGPLRRGARASPPARPPCRRPATTRSRSSTRWRTDASTSTSRSRTRTARRCRCGAACTA